MGENVDTGDLPSQIQPHTEPVVVVMLLLTAVVVAGAWVSYFTGRVALVTAVGAQLAFLAAVHLVELAFHRIAFRRFLPANEEGVSALARGELERAARLWETWTRGRGLSVRAFARYNLAVTLARMGDLAGAIEMHLASERRKQVAHIKGENARHLVLCCALAGRDELAGAWLGVADSRTEGSGPGSRAGLAYVNAVLACRRGKFEKALHLLEQNWTELEAHNRVADMRVKRVMRAFVATCAGGLREAGAAHAFIDGLKPAFSGEFDWLGAGWPEMRTFLETSGLSRVADRSPGG